MTEPTRFPVILCWHMHQPDYRLGDPPVVAEPWAYLHSIGSYADMAAHLEAIPGARAVVNFAPILLEQVAAYAEALEQERPTGDPLLDALRGLRVPTSDEERLDLVLRCLRIHRERTMALHPRLRALLEFGDALAAGRADLGWVSDDYLTDLLCWYHIAWLGEVRARSDARIQRLTQRDAHFDAHDRAGLVAVLEEEIGGLIPRYRSLAERGIVELAASPYAHPILPLLLDFGTARQALADLPLPEADGYPGGRERVVWHLAEARRVFGTHFGSEPAGCWPSEGAVDDVSLELVAAAGFRWAASGMNVLRNSLAAEGREDVLLHRPFRVGAHGPTCFFRDDGLSDRIGFEYADWEARVAVDDLVQHLLELGRIADGAPDGVAVILMDGENAWEHYAENGLGFLRGLYQTLADHPQLRLTTFSAFLDERAEAEPVPLEHVVAGSWVYGTLSTWIGNGARNRLWDALVAVKRIADAVPEDLEGPRRALIERELAACEGSDWWWWAEHDTPGRVTAFEQLFARHAEALCRAAGAPLPAEVRALLDAEVIGVAAGTMRAADH